MTAHWLALPLLLLSADDGLPVEQQAATLGLVALDDAELEGPPRLLDVRDLAVLIERQSVPEPAILRRAFNSADVSVVGLRKVVDGGALDDDNATVRSRTDAGVNDAGGAASSSDDGLTFSRVKLARHILQLKTNDPAANAEVALVAQAEAQDIAEKEQSRAEASARDARENAAQAANAALAQVFNKLAALETQNEMLAGAAAELHEEAARMTKARQADAAAATRVRDDVRSARGRDVAFKVPFNEVLAGESSAIVGFWEALDASNAADADVPALVAAKRALDDAQHAAMPTLSSAIDDEARRTLADAMDNVTTARTRLEKQVDSYREARRRVFFGLTTLHHDLSVKYNEARLELIEHVDAETYNALHRVSEPLAQQNVRVAVKHLALRLRYYVAHRAVNFITLPARIADPLATGALLIALFKAALVLGLAYFLRRKMPAWWKRLRARFLSDVKSAAAHRRRETLAALVEVSAPYAFAMFLAVYIFDLLEPVGPSVEMRVLLEVTLFIVGYRWAARLLHLLMVKLVQKHLRLAPPTKLKMLRSVRKMMRYLFVMGFFLRTTREMVGGGVLYENAKLLAFIGLAIVTLIIIVSWREKISAAYRAENADSSIGRALSERAGTWSEIPYVLIALGILGGHATIVLGKDFVLGFEQTRRALAFLFRLRIERQAKDRPSVAVDIEALPDAVKDALHDVPTEDKGMLIPRFEDVPACVERICRDTARTGMVLVHGPYGVGKTTWLLRLKSEMNADVDAVWWTPTSRVVTRSEFVIAAAALFGVEFEETPSMDALVRALSTRPQTVVFLDGLEWFFLRQLNGYQALDALFELITFTQETFAWVVTVPTPSFRFLCQAQRVQDHASALIELKPWGETEIRDLIHRRQRRSGTTVSFSDLLVQGGNAGDAAAQVVETEEGYIRLLWNFTEGNPRLAQHFWLRSLVRQNQEELRVRLYQAPGPADLETIPESNRFLLAAIVLHRALSIDEAARACNVPAGQVLAHVRRCAEQGIYVATADGRFQVSTLWWEATVRFLRRKNLLIGT